MEKLYYICQWGNEKEKAWSGTCWTLYNALQNYFDVVDIGIPNRFISRLKMFLYNRTNLIKYDFISTDINSFNKHISDIIPKEKVIAFSFSELEYPSNVCSFIYQDMCIEYVQNVIMKDERLKNSFRRNVSKKILQKRQISQKNYYGSCNGIFVMGEWLKSYLIDNMHIDSKKVFCVGAGYDVDIKKYDPSRRTNNKILFVGVDYERKGGPLVVEAFNILKRKYLDNAELYIVGPKKRPKDTFAEGIHYIGNISSFQVSDYYNLCDVLCMPSYLEPFGKAFIEALCFGMPVIARDCFAAPDFIQDGKNGILIQNDDPEILAQNMLLSLSSMEMKTFVKDNMEYIRDYYSWDAVAGRIKEVIAKKCMN